MRTNFSMGGRTARLAVGHRFVVTVDGSGASLGAWSKVSGLQMSWDLAEHRVGVSDQYFKYAAVPKYERLTLSRAANTKDTKTVKAWLEMVHQTGGQPGTGNICVLDAGGNDVLQWDLKELFPIKWSISDFDASSGKVAIETLELIHSGFLTATRSSSGGGRGGRSVGGGGRGGGIQPAADQLSANHLMGHRFEVQLTGHELGAWSKVSGLQMTWDVAEHRVGTSDQYFKYAGVPKYERLKLSRAADLSSQSGVQQWINDVHSSGGVPESGGVNVMTANGSNVLTWEMKEMFPIKWNIGDFDAGSGNVSVETLEIVYSGFLEASRGGRGA